MREPSFWPIEIYTVSSLTSRIRHLINGQFRDVIVEGEISNFKVYPSGHLYFTLKDENAIIKAVFFNYGDRFRGINLGDGLNILCKGRVDVYEKRGEYRLIVEDLDLKGIGISQLKFRILWEKLSKEGLFDPKRKKPLPLLPKCIGIVTSPAGAAIKDMLKVIYSKFENMAVLVYPVKVQGDDAAYEIAEAVDLLNTVKDVDVIIIGRGGGSYEDLSPFNEEVVARAIAASEIPVISAVGHEIDFTIADFVADVRAPTPTAAADLAVGNKYEMVELIQARKKGLERAITGKLERSRLNLIRSSMALKEKRDVFIEYRMFLDDLQNNLFHGFERYITNTKRHLLSLSQRMEDLNPYGILKRGYSITTRKDSGHVVFDAQSVEIKEDVVVRLYRGEIECTVTEKHYRNIIG
ncbi:MAG: exodeoxyribonuclease VII large subunit [Syntrophorhabdaceae bacterium]|nr:exodeoxyribonuclease VII large subunit [Syntrophorhabdaceae bacterium]